MDQPETCAETHSLLSVRGGMDNKLFVIDKCTKAYSGSFRVLFIAPDYIQSVVDALVAMYTRSVPVGYYLILDTTSPDTTDGNARIESRLMTSTRDTTICEAVVTPTRLSCGAYDISVTIHRTRETYTQYTPTSS
ncbi:MAG: hypothetical protein J6Z49_06935 [Kiritimatiellae bacterium]|nr:hypothetical protein [Kiritimatiellia bacterium]